MTKRHTKQDGKQALGQYFTTNASSILSGYEHVVQNADVLDPFAGAGDLLTWALNNGANSVAGFDIVPQATHIVQNDSLMKPPDYTNKIVVTNPPYLSANKCRQGDKSPYTRWKASDYYKCHLASLVDCSEAIEIIPANFFCESRAAARQRLFETHYIVSAKLWTQPVFDDTTTCITAIHLKKGVKKKQEFPMTLIPENTVFTMKLEKKYSYLFGAKFFEYIGDSPEVEITKTDFGMPVPNTNIVVGLLDNGARPVGLSYNSGEVIYCRPKSFTTFQITLPGLDLSTDQQQAVVELFNRRLLHYRAEYHDMFLANYMGPKQKILSRLFVNKLLAKCLDELNLIPSKFNELFT